MEDLTPNEPPAAEAMPAAEAEAMPAAEAEAMPAAEAVPAAEATPEAEAMPETAPVEQTEAPEESAPLALEEPPAAEVPAEVEAEARVEEAAPAEEAATGPGVTGPGAEEEAAEAAAPKPGVPGLDWYIIHTYSGFETKVRDSLQTRADAFGYADRVGEILIPTEDVVEMRNGKKVTSKRLLYPGYALVQLDLDDELWHVVKNTPRVTGFVGGGQKPNPLTADEVNQILYRQTVSAESPRPKMSFAHNDQVKIIDGPFSNFTGTVEEVNEDRSTLKVMVTIFGRGTPVELEYFQVEKEG